MQLPRYSPVKAKRRYTCQVSWQVTRLERNYCGNPAVVCRFDPATKRNCLLCREHHQLCLEREGNCLAPV